MANGVFLRYLKTCNFQRINICAIPEGRVTEISFLRGPTVTAGSTATHQHCH